MNYGKKTPSAPPPRPAFANPRHPMNRETMMVDTSGVTDIATPKPRPARPKKAYKGVTGNYSTD